MAAPLLTPTPSSIQALPATTSFSPCFLPHLLRCLPTVSPCGIHPVLAGHTRVAVRTALIRTWRASATLARQTYRYRSSSTVAPACVVLRCTQGVHGENFFSSAATDVVVFDWFKILSKKIALDSYINPNTLLTVTGP